MARPVDFHETANGANLSTGRSLALGQRRFSDAELAYLKASQLTRGFSESPIRKRSVTKRIYSGLAAVAEAREDWKKLPRRFRVNACGLP